ncbi:hypothetical protein ACHHYP_03841 [Achlya hypogyna]|uniref:Uncharacterized protein n=1 Tax=Achlya hypogyna TaxID=1202772 RepID=A0A1V9Z2U8_ACHHY|nr:hypothetical protein ACHHYP_03841 [Achlya hypogyna]
MVRRPFLKAALDGVLPSKKLKRQIEHMAGSLHHATEAHDQALADLAAVTAKYDHLCAENARLHDELEAAHATVATLEAEHATVLAARDARVYQLEAELRLQEALKLQFNAERMASELEAMQAHAENQRRLNQLEDDLIMARETLHTFMRQQAKLRAAAQNSGDGVAAAAHVQSLETKCRDLQDDLHVYMQLNAFLRQENNEKTLALQAALHNLYDASKKMVAKSPRKTAAVAVPVAVAAPVEYIECTSSSDSEDLTEAPQYVDWEDESHDVAVFQSLHGLIQKRALKALAPLQIPKISVAPSHIHHGKGSVRKRVPAKTSPRKCTPRTAAKAKVCHTSAPTTTYCL